MISGCQTQLYGNNRNSDRRLVPPTAERITSGWQAYPFCIRVMHLFYHQLRAEPITANLCCQMGEDRVPPPQEYDGKACLDVFCEEVRTLISFVSFLQG